MTVLYMRFPGQFSQIGFSWYLVWKHSKKHPWDTFVGLLSIFFWKSAKCDEFWIFLPFWQNMLLVWLTNNNKYSGALRKRCLKVNKLKEFFFFQFWTCFFTPNNMKNQFVKTVPEISCRIQSWPQMISNIFANSRYWIALNFKSLSQSLAQFFSPLVKTIL